MKNKWMTFVGIGIAALFIFTLYLYLMAKDSIELFDVITVPIVLLLVLSVIYLMWDRIKNMNAGLPVEDERVKNMSYRAGYYAFIVAIWSAIGSNMLSIFLYDKDLRGGLVVAAVVISSGVVFMGYYLYSMHKGR